MPPAAFNQGFLKAREPEGPEIRYTIRYVFLVHSFYQILGGIPSPVVPSHGSEVNSCLTVYCFAETLEKERAIVFYMSKF